MVKTTFIATLRGLHIPEGMGRGDKLDDETFITNDKGFVVPLLTKDWEEQIGLVDIRLMNEAEVWVYGVYGMDEENFSTGKFLIGRMEMVREFLLNMWIIKDNAVNVELGWLRTVFPNQDKCYSKSDFFSPFFRANGRPPEHSLEVLSRKDIRTARELLEIFRTVRSDEDSFLTRKHNVKRTTRAEYMIRHARMIEDVAVRIALYVTAMETIFTSGDRELGHQLAERMAFFLGRTAEERQDVYRQVKIFYNVRSAVVHGGVVRDQYSAKDSDKKLTLAEVSVACDHFLRQCLLTIFIEFKGELPLDLDCYFLGLILGQGQQPPMKKAADREVRWGEDFEPSDHG